MDRARNLLSNALFPVENGSRLTKIDDLKRKRMKFRFEWSFSGRKRCRIDEVEAEATQERVGEDEVSGMIFSIKAPHKKVVNVLEFIE